MKLLLGARDAAAAREALAVFPSSRPDGVQAESLGTVAEARGGGGARCSLCVVPGGELGRPLWRPFGL